MHNRMELTFSAQAQNEAFARVTIAAFAVQLNPTLPEMADIKTAVSEAVTNAIVHGYAGRDDGMVCMRADFSDQRMLTVTVSDNGCGIRPDRLEGLFRGYSSREDTADGSKRGAGIGLSVCATIIKAHGGTITAENAKSGGAVFRFALALEEETHEQ